VLTYWPIRGLAERIRLLLEYLELPYEDRKITDRDEWFNKEKPSINDPFINLPFLKDGEEIISESEAILFHLIFKANKKELLGKDEKQKVEVAKIRGAFNDMYSAYVRVMYGGGELEKVKPGLLESLKGSLAK
jgi:glutathione S-transferase